MKNGTEQASLQSKLGSNSVGIAYFASRPLQSLTRVFCLDIVEGLKTATEIALLFLMASFENIKHIREGAVKKAKSL